MEVQLHEEEHLVHEFVGLIEQHLTHSLEEVELHNILIKNFEKDDVLTDLEHNKVNQKSQLRVAAGLLHLRQHGQLAERGLATAEGERANSSVASVTNDFLGDYEPTVLNVYRGTKLVKTTQIEIKIHDTGRDRHLGVNRATRYCNAQVSIICVAAKSQDSYENIDRWKV